VVVELDRQKSCSSKRSWRAARPDLARAGAVRVGPEAEFFERGPSDDPPVGSPDAVVARVMDDGHLVRGEIPAPSLSVRPRDRQPAVEPDASRKRAGDGPADVAVAVSDHEVLVGNAEPVPDGERRAGAVGPLELEHAARLIATGSCAIQR
jgi:hypothetical protein